MASAPGPAVAAAAGGRACVGIRSSAGGSGGLAVLAGIRTGRGTVSEVAAGIRAGGGMVVSTVRVVGTAWTGAGGGTGIGRATGAAGGLGAAGSGAAGVTVIGGADGRGGTRTVPKRYGSGKLAP
jgi:hypothetical protein